MFTNCSAADLAQLGGLVLAVASSSAALVGLFVRMSLTAQLSRFKLEITELLESRYVSRRECELLRAKNPDHGRESS